MKLIPIIIGSSSLFLVAGCASSQRPVAYSTSASAYDYNAANRALETTVRAEVNRYGDLAAFTPDLRIHARDGVVTLRGNVPGERERQMLDDVVRNTAGVVTVNDQLQIAYPPTGVTNPRVYSSAPAPVVSSATTVIVPSAPTVTTAPSLVIQASTERDRQVAGSIINQLHADGIPALWVQNLSISVNGDEIYLRGFVSDASEHRAILASVKRIPGVSTVFDELQIR